MQICKESYDHHQRRCSNFEWMTFLRSWLILSWVSLSFMTDIIFWDLLLYDIFQPLLSPLFSTDLLSPLSSLRPLPFRCAQSILFSLWSLWLFGRWLSRRDVPPYRLSSLFSLRKEEISPSNLKVFSVRLLCKAFISCVIMNILIVVFVDLGVSSKALCGPSWPLLASLLEYPGIF